MIFLMVTVVLGYCEDLYLKIFPLLEKNRAHILIFVDTDLPLSTPVFSPQIRLFTIRNLFDRSMICAKIAEIAALNPLEIISGREDPLFSDFEENLKFMHMHMTNRLIDFADFGILTYQNAKKNLKIPHQKWTNLENAAINVPAIVIGAGPSLEKDLQFIQKFQSNLLIIGCGNVLKKLSFSPDFSVIMDPNELLEDLKFPQSPVFFQARCNPEALRKFSSHKFLVPESHFPLIDALTSDEKEIFLGNNCGVLACQIALHLGCNPIITAGLDFCYQDGKKYAFDHPNEGEGLVATKNLLGEKVFTQTDWIVAVNDLKRLVVDFPQTKFFSLSLQGLEYFPHSSLEDVLCSLPPQDFSEKLKTKIEQGKVEAFDSFHLWDEKFKQAPLDVLAENSQINQKLLNPLWEVWRGVFEKNFLFPTLEEMLLHKRAFFELVLKQYIEKIDVS